MAIEGLVQTAYDAKGVVDTVSGDETARTTGEVAYLNSMMPEVRQQGYTCVSGCSDCASCDGND